MPVALVPYVHVDNLAQAVVMASSNHVATGRTYNVIDGYAPTGEYLRAVCAAAEIPARVLPPDAPTVRYAGDRIRHELRSP